MIGSNGFTTLFCHLTDQHVAPELHGLLAGEPVLALGARDGGPLHHPPQQPDLLADHEPPGVARRDGRGQENDRSGMSRFYPPH